MEFNFIVKATVWSDNDTWEADFVPAWFDDETKKDERYQHELFCTIW